MHNIGNKNEVLGCLGMQPPFCLIVDYALNTDAHLQNDSAIVQYSYCLLCL
jgi:hypothetical protein